MSLRCDQLSSLDITADTVSERSRLPKPESLRGKLLLADRGYFDVAYVNQVAACGGHVLQRVQQANPIVEVTRINGRRVPVLDGVELVALLSAARDAALDLDVLWPRKQIRLRIVSFSPPDAETRTTLITSLPRSQFSAAQLGQLYRLRWQIEILFKELKSFARLGRWNTRKESLTRALIWGSVLVMTLKRFLAHRAVPTGVVASTLSAAKALPLVLGDVLLAMIRRRSITAPFRRMMRFLGTHAPRAHPNRDLRQGRLACGLRAAAA